MNRVFRVSLVYRAKRERKEILLKNILTILPKKMFQKLLMKGIGKGVKSFKDGLNDIEKDINEAPQKKEEKQ